MSALDGKQPAGPHNRIHMDAAGDVNSEAWVERNFGKKVLTGEKFQLQGGQTIAIHRRVKEQ